MTTKRGSLHFEVLSFEKDRILVPLMKGAANVTMDPEDLKEVLFPLPPLEIQTSISFKDDYEKIRGGITLALNHYRPEFSQNSDKQISFLKDVLLETEKKLSRIMTISEVWGETK